MIYGLRKAKAIVGKSCTGVEEKDGKFFIKFSVSDKDSRIDVLREMSIVQLKKSKTGVYGKIQVNSDPCNGSGEDLSKHYEKKKKRKL